VSALTKSTEINQTAGNFRPWVSLWDVGIRINICLVLRTGLSSQPVQLVQFLANCLFLWNFGQRSGGDSGPILPLFCRTSPEFSRMRACRIACNRIAIRSEE